MGSIVAGGGFGGDVAVADIFGDGLARTPVWIAVAATAAAFYHEDVTRLQQLALEFAVAVRERLARYAFEMDAIR